MSQITAPAGPRATLLALGAGLRGAAGLLGVAGGLLLLVSEWALGDPIGYYLVFAAVLTLGGAVLLGWRLLRLPTRLGVLGPVAAAVAGTPAGLLVVRESVGGMWVYSEARGYPFSWWGRAAEFAHPADAEQVQAAMAAGSVAIRWDTLAADAVFWGYAGVVLVAVATVAWRAWHGRAGVRP